MNIEAQRVQHIKDAKELQELENLEALYERIYIRMPQEIKEAIELRKKELK